MDQSGALPTPTGRRAGHVISEDSSYICRDFVEIESTISSLFHACRHPSSVHQHHSAVLGWHET